MGSTNFKTPPDEGRHQLLAYLVVNRAKHQRIEGQNGVPTARSPYHSPEDGAIYSAALQPIP